MSRTLLQTLVLEISNGTDFFDQLDRIEKPYRQMQSQTAVKLTSGENA
jgi:hypothetical protein